MALKESMNYFISKYKDEMCFDLLEWCKEGKSVESWAASVNMIPDVIPILMKLHQEFDICVRVAYWKSFAYWDNLALEDSKLTNSRKTLNPQIYNMVMRQRYKFVDTKEEIMKELSMMSDDELEERCRVVLDSEKSINTIEIGVEDD
jgi:hypothetical protein